MRRLPLPLFKYFFVGTPVARAGFVAFLLVLATTMLGVAVSAPPSGALSTGCGSLPSDNNVYIGRPDHCVVPPASKPYLSFEDGKRVDVAMGPNNLFSPKDKLSGEVEALECEYNNGAGGPGDPPNATDYCDVQTVAGDFPFTVGANGAFDYAADNNGDLVAMFALPGSILKTATITCNPKHPCVLYVGEDYNDFTTPHVFSNPFVMDGPPLKGGSFPIWLLIVLVLVVLGVLAVAAQRVRAARA